MEEYLQCTDITFLDAFEALIALTEPLLYIWARMIVEFVIFLVSLVLAYSNSIVNQKRQMLRQWCNYIVTLIKSANSPSLSSFSFSLPLA